MPPAAPGTLAASLPFASLAFTVLALLVACSDPPPTAVLDGGHATYRVNGVETKSATGPVGFGNGASVGAEGGVVRARVLWGAERSNGSHGDGKPPRGVADLTLADGTLLSRRAGTVFDLHKGALSIHAGPLAARVVIFHGESLLEIPDTNSDGVQLEVTTEGDSMSVVVTTGNVLLTTPVIAGGEKNLSFVKLGPGEGATVKPGTEPERHRSSEPATDAGDGE
jgi:hypothetical protein